MQGLGEDTASGAAVPYEKGRGGLTTVARHSASDESKPQRHL